MPDEIKRLQNELVCIYQADKDCGAAFEDSEIIAAYEAAIKALERQMPKPPVPSQTSKDRYGRAVPRCQVCGYALDLQMEQYCPCCGQRLTEYEEGE